MSERGWLRGWGGRVTVTVPVPPVVEGYPTRRSPFGQCLRACGGRGRDVHEAVSGQRVAYVYAPTATATATAGGLRAVVPGQLA